MYTYSFIGNNATTNSAGINLVFNTSSAQTNAQQILGMTGAQKSDAGMTSSAYAVDPNNNNNNNNAPPSPSPNGSPENDGKSSNAGAVAGGVIAGVVVLGIVGFLIYRKNQHQSTSSSSSSSGTANQHFEQTVDYRQLQDAV